MTDFGQTTFTVAAAGLFVLGVLAARGQAAAHVAPSAGETAPAADDNSIRPFQFHAPDEALADLRRRIGATKWPAREMVTDAWQGVQLATMRELARYWQTDYDWHKVEARLNALPQFMTNPWPGSDGIITSKASDALPPVAVSYFPDELYQAPRSWTERAYPKLIYYNKLDKSGHFAAWEQPQLFATEMRAAFKSLR